MKKLIPFMIYLLFGLALVQCSPAPSPQADHSIADAIVLSGINRDNGSQSNQLAFINTQGRQTDHIVPIRSSTVADLYIDPMSRVWIGYSGTWEFSDNIVEVYTTDGTLLKTIDVCLEPESGIHFTESRAFVVCTEDGFAGRVSVVNLQTLVVETQIDVKLPDQPLILSSSALLNNTLLIAGLTSGPQERSAYTVLTFIDTNSLVQQSQLAPIADLDVWEILTDQEQFILLNVASWQQTNKRPADLLLIRMGSQPEIQEVYLPNPSPVWGALDGDVLITYHNPTWNQLNNDSRRWIGKYNLATQDSETWQLPDEWFASDIAVVGGDTLLVSWDPTDEKKDGIYQFNYETGKLYQVLNVSGSNRMVTIK